MTEIRKGRMHSPPCIGGGFTSKISPFSGSPLNLLRPLTRGNGGPSRPMSRKCVSPVGLSDMPSNYETKLVSGDQRIGDCWEPLRIRYLEREGGPRMLPQILSRGHVQVQVFHGEKEVNLLRVEVMSGLSGGGVGGLDKEHAGRKNIMNINMTERGRKSPIIGVENMGVEKRDERKWGISPREKLPPIPSPRPFNSNYVPTSLYKRSSPFSPPNYYSSSPQFIPPPKFTFPNAY